MKKLAAILLLLAAQAFGQAPAVPQGFIYVTDAQGHSVSTLSAYSGSSASTRGSSLVTKAASGTSTQVFHLAGTTFTCASIPSTTPSYRGQGPSTVITISGSTLSQLWTFISQSANMTVVGSDGMVNIPAEGIWCCKLVHADGTVRYFKPTANTAAARGTTLASAKSAATSGDMIYVPTGSYSLSSNLGKDGVDWYFYAGAAVTYSDTGADGCIFDDGGTAMTFKVGGFGNFTRTTSSPPGAAFSGIVCASNASTSILLSADTLTASSSGGTTTKISTCACTAGKLVVNANKIIATNVGVNNVLWWTNGEMEITAQQIDGSGCGYVIYSKTDSTLTGDLHIRCHNLVGTISTNGSVAGAIWIDTHLWTLATLLKPGALDGSVVSAEKVYIAAQKIVATGSAVTCGDGLLYILGFPKISGDLTDNTTAYFQCTAGTAYITISQVDPSTSASSNILINNGGTSFIDGLDLTSASGINAFKVTSGTMNLLSGKISTSGGGLDLQRTGGTLNVGPNVAYNPANTSGLITGLSGAPYTQKATTTNNTQATAQTITIPSSTTVALKARVYARRTGGSAGTAEDAAVYEINATVKNVSGTATLVGAVTQTVVQEDQAAWDATIDVTGATARIRITGATNNNVSWVVQTTVQTVSS